MQIIAVLAFPPNECCKILVSLESLYGTCPVFLPPPLKTTQENRKQDIYDKEKEIRFLQ